MARKLSFAASRHRDVRLFRWSALALAGVVAGMLLGEMAAGTRLRSGDGEPASYSHLSANPDALVAQGDGGIVPCPGCADSYGVAVRLRANRNGRMSDEFRELGAVDVDPPKFADAGDDYRYGGRFPDSVTGTEIDETQKIVPANDVPSTIEEAPALAEY